jgi:hypothetical protein
MEDSALETHEAMRGILATCENGHEQRLLTPDRTVRSARRLAGIMDGTSPFYAFPPRTHPIQGGKVGKCGICDAWISCTLFGYEDEEGGSAHF